MPNSWRTRNQRHGFVAGWHWQKIWSGIPICLYCLKCTKFGLLILRKIIKTVATRCQILRLGCTKFDFGWGYTPDPAGGHHSALPNLAVFKGPISKGGRERGKEKERQGMEGDSPQVFTWIDAFAFRSGSNKWCHTMIMTGYLLLLSTLCNCQYVLGNAAPAHQSTTIYRITLPTSWPAVCSGKNLQINMCT